MKPLRGFFSCISTPVWGIFQRPHHSLHVLCQCTSQVQEQNSLCHKSSHLTHFPFLLYLFDGMRNFTSGLLSTFMAVSICALGVNFTWMRRIFFAVTRSAVAAPLDLHVRWKLPRSPRRTE